MLRLQKFLPVLWNLLNLTHIINGKLASTRKRCKIFLGDLQINPLGWLTSKKSPTKNGLMLLFFFSNGPRKNWYFGRDGKWYFLGWVSACLESQNTSYKAGWIKNVNQTLSFYSSIFGGKEKNANLKLQMKIHELLQGSNFGGSPMFFDFKNGRKKIWNPIICQNEAVRPWGPWRCWGAAPDFQVSSGKWRFENANFLKKKIL